MSGLLHLEGQAVRALTYSGVSLVSSDLDLVKRAVILAAAVVLAVVDSAADVLVCKFSSHYITFLSFIRRQNAVRRSVPP